MPPRYDDADDDDRDWDEHDYDDDQDFDDEGDEGDEDDDATVYCPHCGRALYDDAEQCPHCGEYLSDADLAGRGKPFWIVVTALVVAGALLIYAIR